MNEPACLADLGSYLADNVGGDHLHREVAMSMQITKVHYRCGGDAREALTEMETAFHDGALCWPDWVLAELWDRGFKVVPVENSDESSEGGTV